MSLDLPPHRVLAGLGLAIAAAAVPSIVHAGNGGCEGYSKCPTTNYATVERNNPDAQRVRDDIADMEAQGLREMRSGHLTRNQAAIVLGKLIIHDTSLSALGNRACASCHVPSTGFTGGISVFNQDNVAYPGSVVNRSGPRKPMSYAYAPFAPTLRYDTTLGDFVGGDFFDDRATGHKTGNPAGDQAQDPPLDAAELGMRDAGCVMYRIKIGPYRDLFASVWGAEAFNIQFPANAAAVCAGPHSTNNSNPKVLTLDQASRHQVELDYDGFGVSAAMYEASPEVSPFTSKFDRYLAGSATLSPSESRGFALFTGKANCASCHTASGSRPLFTSFNTANIGVPRNIDLPYLHENVPDDHGYVANSAGTNYVDNGVADYLSGHLMGSTKPTEMEEALAPQFMGRFQVQTLRNVDKRPYASFVRDYTHNGFFKSLASIVHFYNTRDVLPTCTYSSPEDGDGKVGVTCWPAPEQPENENHTLVGNLGLSNSEEADIVAFLGTLSDTKLAKSASGP